MTNNDTDKKIRTLRNFMRLFNRMSELMQKPEMQSLTDSLEDFPKLNCWCDCCMEDGSCCGVKLHDVQ